MRPVRGLCEAGKTVRKTEPRRFLDWQRRWPNNGEVSVVDDIKLALLGNKEAAKRLTEAGVLVPCPFCGGEAEVVAYGPRLLRPSRNHVYSVSCNECEMMFGWDVDYGGRYDTEYEVMLAWNTRAPILSAEELQRLEAQT